MTDPTAGPSPDPALLAALPDALAELPADLPPPPHLDAAVLAAARSASPAGPPPPTARRSAPAWPRWTVGVALAAGALLGVTLAPRAAPVVVLTPGAHRVEGPATVHLPGGVLALDGVAAISMEPAPGGLRASPASPASLEPAMFTSRDLLSAGGGATVTLAVLAGTGTWTPTDADAGEVLTAGEGRRVTPTTAGLSPRTVATRTTSDASPPAADSVDTLRADNAELRASVDALDFEVKALRGQLAAYGATAIEWPDDLPAPYEPEAYTRWAESMLDDVPGFTLAEVDCSEFPCLVLVEPGPEAPRKDDGSVDWEVAAQPFQDTRPPGLHDDEPTSAGISVMETNDNGDRSGVMVLYNAPDSHLGGGVPERLQVRTRDAVQRLAEADAPQ